MFFSITSLANEMFVCQTPQPPPPTVLKIEKAFLDSWLTWHHKCFGEMVDLHHQCFCHSSCVQLAFVPESQNQLFLGFILGKRVYSLPPPFKNMLGLSSPIQTPPVATQWCQHDYHCIHRGVSECWSLLGVRENVFIYPGICPNSFHGSFGCVNCIAAASPY